MPIRYLSSASSRPLSLWRKLLTVMVSLALLAVALMFSALLLVILAIGGAYLWWKTRAVRKQGRGFAPSGSMRHEEVFANEVFVGKIIEGEAVRVPEPNAGIENPAPPQRVR
jgi:hypothetical protein